MRRPDFLVIGAQKSASTALATSIARHPDAWMPAAEDHYLHDPYFGVEPVEHFLAPYASRTEQRVGLTCPDYLGQPHVPERVREVLGTPDVVCCLRDPVDRFVSAYYWHMRWGTLPVAPLEVGVPRLLDGTYDDVPMAWHLLEYGRYAHLLRGWFAHLPRERFCLLLQEDLRAEPGTTLRTLLDFLDLDPVRATRLDDSTSVNPGVYPMPRVRFLQLRARLVTRMDPTNTFVTLPVPASRSGRALNKALAGIDRYLLSRVFGNEPPRLDAGLRARLREFYADDVTDLETLLGRDLGRWRR